VVIGTRDRATLFALDAATGRPAWTVYFWLSWVDSTARLVDDLLYVGSSDSRRIRVLDPATGRAVWTAQVFGWSWGTPLVIGDRVYYGTGGTDHYFISQRASLGALDRRTGAPLWRRPIANSPDAYISGIAASLAAAGDRILAAGLDGMLTAFPTRP
jgi:outer membrane protein assembly factor BamB